MNFQNNCLFTSRFYEINVDRFESLWLQVVFRSSYVCISYVHIVSLCCLWWSIHHPHLMHIFPLGGFKLTILDNFQDSLVFWISIMTPSTENSLLSLPINTIYSELNTDQLFFTNGLYISFQLLQFPGRNHLRHYVISQTALKRYCWCIITTKIA